MQSADQMPHVGSQRLLLWPVSDILGVSAMPSIESDAITGFGFQSNRYWSDAGKPGNTGRSDDFEHCLNDRNCAEVAVRGYMSKWKKDCNNDGVIDCLDFAAIHKVLLFFGKIP